MAHKWHSQRIQCHEEAGGKELDPHQQPGRGKGPRLFSGRAKQFSGVEADRQGHDSTTKSEGANFNIGVGSLLNLVRALAKDHKVVVLNDATSVGCSSPGYFMLNYLRASDDRERGPAHQLEHHLRPFVAFHPSILSCYSQ